MSLRAPLMSEAKSAVSRGPFALSRACRLDSPAVAAVLKIGRRIQATPQVKPPSGALVTIKFVQRAPELASAAAHARLAIAVPKRLMKSAVDRNRIKRWTREAFRQHPLRLLPIDLLVTLNTKVDLDVSGQRAATRAALLEVFGLAQKEAERGRVPVLPPQPFPPRTIEAS
jgi:ribonuclease P protein component